MFGRTISASGVTELRKRVAGTVCVRGEEGYQRLAAAWNLTATQEPAVVVAPSSASDIAQAVRIAGAEGLRVAVQTTGHGAAGLVGGDTPLLNMRTLDGIHVDGAARIAEVGAGATWDALSRRAATDGLAGLAGIASGIGIAGYTFLGGVGWLARPRGLASAARVGVDYVDAAGHIGQADEHADPDALWAFRGGGVGIATGLRFRLFPHARLYAGARLWPVEDTPTILARWLAWTASVPPRSRRWPGPSRLRMRRAYQSRSAVGPSSAWAPAGPSLAAIERASPTSLPGSPRRCSTPSVTGRPPSSATSTWTHPDRRRRSARDACSRAPTQRRPVRCSRRRASPTGDRSGSSSCATSAAPPPRDRPRGRSPHSTVSSSSTPPALPVTPCKRRPSRFSCASSPPPRQRSISGAASPPFAAATPTPPEP